MRWRLRGRAGPDRLSIRAGDFLLPYLLYLAGDLFRYRHVVQFLRHLVAVAVGPIEEVEDLFGLMRILRLLMQQDESGAGDRPALGARLVGQYDAETRLAAPVGAGSGGLE